MGLNEGLGILGTVLFSIMLLTGIMYYHEYSKPVEPANESIIEKTAQTTQGEIDVMTDAYGKPVSDYVMKIDDLAMSLLILDEYHPYPEIIKLEWKSTDGLILNSTDTIVINDDFLNNRSDIIRTKVLNKRNSLNENHRVHYRLEVDDNGKTAWVYEIWKGVT